jgi:hypothetical protein
MNNDIIYNETQRVRNSQTTHYFFVDGFQRQANNTLRRLMLDAFPTISIEEKIRHTIDSFENAINKDNIVICTLRNPFDAINSFCGYKKIDPLDVDNVNYMLEVYCSLHYKLLKKKQKITFINFEDIINNPSKILLYIKNKFNIKEDNIEKYKNLKLTPFLLSLDKDGFDAHNKTSSLLIEDKLNTIANYTDFKKAQKIYNILNVESIRLENI